MGEKLLIIGNGFDKQCNLMSSFNDYFKYLTKRFPPLLEIRTVGSDYILLKIDGEGKFLSFWEVLLALHPDSRGNWKDVEFLIHSHLEKTYKQEEESFCNIEMVVNYRFGYKKLPENFKLTSKDIEYLKYFCDKYIENIAKNGPFYASDFIAHEISVFEKNFATYLATCINKDYLYSSLSLLSKLTSFHKNSHFSLMNFNYTEPPLPAVITKNTNVHGTLTDNNIIIGIDYRDFEPVDLGFKFTKTYRKMQHIPKQIKEFTLSRNIDGIVFYGHSLNKQDYSYFQAIFDFLDIYNNNISLTFLYAVNYLEAENKEEIALLDMTNLASTLIVYYGRTLANPDHGRNLLHKLLVEGRIKFRNIEAQEPQEV